MKAALKVAGLMIGLTLWIAQEGLAKTKTYQVSPVTNGGSLAGSVSFKGKIPEPILEDLKKGKNSEFCARHPDAKEGGIRPRYKVVVTDGKLQDTVVFIENIEQGKDWSSQTINFDLETATFFPRFQWYGKPLRR